MSFNGLRGRVRFGYSFGLLFAYWAFPVFGGTFLWLRVSFFALGIVLARVCPFWIPDPLYFWRPLMGVVLSSEAFIGAPVKFSSGYLVHCLKLLFLLPVFSLFDVCCALIPFVLRISGK